jgi:hypothetical protein
VDSTVLFNLHGSLNSSTLNNGCIVYGQDRKSCIQLINTLHYKDYDSNLDLSELLQFRVFTLKQMIRHWKPDVCTNQPI